MKLKGVGVSCLWLIGCASTLGVGGSGQGAPSELQPAVRHELPWLELPTGRMRTTFFCGPWQCRQEFMNDCQRQCGAQSHLLMGCVWLADIRLEWEGQLLRPPIPVSAGSRYGLYHCCCDYPELSPAQTATRRRDWERIRSAFRREWSERFGAWPGTGAKAWPGHHIRDLWHSGDPVDPNNVFPARPDVHEAYNRAYPACYAGQAPWNTVGVPLPYKDG